MSNRMGPSDKKMALKIASIALVAAAASAPLVVVEAYQPSYLLFPKLSHQRVSGSSKFRTALRMESASLSNSDHMNIDNALGNANTINDIPDLRPMVGLHRRGRHGRKVYLPDHLSVPETNNSNGTAKRRGMRALFISSLRKIVQIVALSLALWKVTALATGGTQHQAGYVSAATTTNARVITPSAGNGGSASRMLVAKDISSSSSNAREIVISTRGGGRRSAKAGKTKEIAEAPTTQQTIQTHLENIATKSKSAVQSTYTSAAQKASSAIQTFNELPNASRNKLLFGVGAAAAIGVGVGVELTTHKDEDAERLKREEERAKLSNTERLRMDIMDDIERYEQTYGTLEGEDAMPSSSSSPSADLPTPLPSPMPQPSTNSEDTSPTREVRKPDPADQVRAILDAAKETERRARIERRRHPTDVQGVDYSQVKGLSTSEGDGRDRVQRLVDSTAEMERRAEAARLENARKRDMDDEQKALHMRESLKTRIDSFIAVTEAEEKSQGFGNQRGDNGRALRAEVAKLNAELDRTRSQMFILEAELKEQKMTFDNTLQERTQALEKTLQERTLAFEEEVTKRKETEAMLRKELDRLRRSGGR